jgi:uncharacterized protein (TIGR02996 family)
MDHEEGFFRAIDAEPHEDLHRWAYADWLEEQGEADRAEYLRVGCALARLPADDPGRPALEARERSLREELLRGWLAPLGSSAAEVRFHRGLVDTVFLDSRAYLGCAAFLAERVRPRHLFLFRASRDIDDKDDVMALAASPHLARVEGLDLRNNYLGAADAQALADSPHVGGLTDLQLEENNVGAEGAAALAGSPFLARLRTLGLSGNLLGDAGVEGLASCTGLRRLQVLHLAHNSITDHGLALLADSSLLARLTSLDLARNLLGDRGARALAASPHLGRLRVLDLRDNFLGDAGLYALAGCAALQGLTALDVSGNTFGQPGLGAWAASPFIGKLFHGPR